MLPRIVATSSLAALVALFALMTFSTPSTAGPFGLLLIFISAYVFLIGFISLFLFGMNRLIIFLSSGLVAKRPLQPLAFRRSYQYSTVLAMAPVMLVGLQSVGAIGIYGVLLVAIFEVIACMYVSRRVS